MRQRLGGAGDRKIDDGKQGDGGATLRCLVIFGATDSLYKSLRAARNDGCRDCVPLSSRPPPRRWPRLQRDIGQAEQPSILGVQLELLRRAAFRAIDQDRLDLL